MSLIDNTYFNGERNIPNTAYDGVDTTLTNLIAVREKEFLIKLLSYQLYKLFVADIALPTPSQRFTDILFGTDYTNSRGELDRWNGLVSITTPQQTLSVSVGGSSDIFFTVDVTTGAPASGANTYVNANLANTTYKVVQRGYGFLEPLKIDNSNVGTANILINSSGGFTLLNGFTFSANDTYMITDISNSINVSNVPIVAIPDSPIADYVYYYWLKQQHTQTAGIGEVKPQGQNSKPVSPKHKAAKAWNDMVEKSFKLYEFLKLNSTVYPEYQIYLSSQDLQCLLTRIHPFF